MYNIANILLGLVKKGGVTIESFRENNPELFETFKVESFWIDKDDSDYCREFYIFPNLSQKEEDYFIIPGIDVFSAERVDILFHMVNDKLTINEENLWMVNYQSNYYVWNKQH